MMRSERKSAAVIVGYHTYEVRAFQDMLESFEGLHCYVQHLEQQAGAAGEGAGAAAGNTGCGLIERNSK